MLLGNKGNVILTKKVWFSDKLWLNIDMTNATDTMKAPCTFCNADSIRPDKIEYKFKTVKSFCNFLRARFEKEYSDCIYIECFIDEYRLTYEDYEAMTPHELNLFLDCFYPEA